MDQLAFQACDFWYGSSCPMTSRWRSAPPGSL